MAKCISCGAKVSMWNGHTIYLFRVEQYLCQDCMKRHQEKYEAADEEGKFAVMERLARSPYLNNPRDVERNMPEVREQLRQSLEKKRRQEEAAAERRAYTGTFASCCGRPMTELGVSKFQLGEHSFFLGDMSHLMEGSMSMAIFRCDTCGQLKMFDPSLIKAK